MRVLAVGLIAMSVATALPLSGYAQTQPALSFEAASIRPSTSKSVRGSEGGPGTRSPTLYRFESATLLDLICVAWKVDGFQVKGRESLDRENFDLSARMPEGATREQFRTMLQNLLADRFLLKTHMETRDFPSLALVVAKSGFKLKPAAAGDPAPAPPHSASVADWPTLPPGRPQVAAHYSTSGEYTLVRFRMQLEPLSMFARMMRTYPDGPPIVDKTGLPGTYSFALEFSRVPNGANPETPPPAPDEFTAVKDQLGLELVSKKLPFDVVVVESFNKLPTEN